ncbi:MAG TPA: hypothetical protein VI248_25365 [Kineosporiaceae bacterium]
MARSQPVSPSRRRPFPVTVTKLPTVRCEVCQTTLAHRPGQATDTLTHHYQTEHPATLPR